MNGQTQVFDAGQGRARTATGIDAGTDSGSPRLRCWCAECNPAGLTVNDPWLSPSHGTTRPRPAGLVQRINTAAPEIVWVSPCTNIKTGVWR